MKIRAIRRDLQAGFEQRDGIFKIVLRHANAGHQENDIRILRGEFVSADERIQCVYRSRLVEVNLPQQVQGIGRVGLQLQCAIE